MTSDNDRLTPKAATAVAAVAPPGTALANTALANTALADIARIVRGDVLDMSFRAKTPHLGSTMARNKLNDTTTLVVKSTLKTARLIPSGTDCNTPV
jgi:geranylgeranyl pyrophosphate synthase